MAAGRNLGSSIKRAEEKLHMQLEQTLSLGLQVQIPEGSGTPKREKLQLESL